MSENLILFFVGLGGLLMLVASRHVAITPVDNNLEYDMTTDDVNVDTVPFSEGGTLAMRNNNPLNIRDYASNPWQGKIGVNKGFVVFSDPIYGYRAAFRILENYEIRGIDTVAKIIYEWAPPTENDTEAYIRYIEENTYLDRNSIITRQNQVDLLMAMTMYEAGAGHQFTAVQAREGLEMLA